MKSKLVLGFAAVLACWCFSPAVRAQSEQDKTDKSADARTITGCLSNGEKTGEYNLTTSDGSTWEVKSTSVKLSDHVGHTVTVTGKVSHPDMHGAKEKAKDTMDSTAKEHGHMTATDVSMVSDSCKK
jgi:uncharacterized protein DUF5818